jgi:hypothetical protein|nr:hypothetical protein [Neorhizobium tomejilense]
METIRIEDYLHEHEAHVWVSCPDGGYDLLARTVAYCGFVSLEIDLDRSLTPADIRDLLVTHYGYTNADETPSVREIDLSMERTMYEVMGRPTVERGILLRDPAFHREGLAEDIRARLALRPLD